MTRRSLPRSVALPAAAVTLTLLFVAAGAPSPLLVYYQREWHFASGALTLAFGVYAIGILGALLVVGSLSDFVGRRPVVVGALVLELGALLVFLRAGSVEELVWARLVQGVATGAATSALTAWMLELAPSRFARTANVVGSIAPAGGLGLGALLAGLAASTVEDPPAVAWIALLVAISVGLVVAAASPETRTRTPGGGRSLVPRLRVARDLRSLFIAALPIQIGAWLVAALFIGLMPTILTTLFGLDSLFTGGSIVFVEPAAACVAAVAFARSSAVWTLRLAAALIAAGAVLMLAGILGAVLPLLLLGGAIGGAGFGAANSGTFRLLLPRARADGRSALVSAIYVAAYLAFGIPAIVAGLLVPVVGLEWVALGFTALIALSACIGVVSSSGRGTRSHASFGAEPDER